MEDSKKNQTSADQPVDTKPAEASADTGDSKKHKSFVDEPMTDKPVTALPGIGKKLGGRLTEKGFDKAYKVFAQYLMLDKDEDSFKKWLDEIARANKGEQDECYKCLKDWCAKFFQ